MGLSVRREESLAADSEQLAGIKAAVPSWRLVKALAVFVALASLSKALSQSDGSVLAAVLEPSTAMIVALAITLFGFLEATAALALTLLLFISYLLFHQVPSQVGLSFCYLVLMGIGSYFWAGRLQRGALSAMGDESIAFRCFLSGVVLIGVTCGLSVLALLAQQHRPLVLIPASILWAVVAFACNKPSQTFAADESGALAKEPREANQRSIVPILRFLTITIILLSAVAHLHADWNTGDANKSYLAFTKYYSWTNSIVLNEPAWERDQNHAFPHLQEMLLATGFTLDGRLGAKLFAVLILLVKLQALFWVARRSFGFSEQRAWLLLFSFVSVPIIADMNMVVRPENLLTIFTLYAFFFFEEATRRLAGPVSQQLDSTNPEYSRTVLIGTVLAGCMVLNAASVKYTGLYLGIVFALVYWRSLWFTLRRFRQVQFPLLALSGGCFAVFCFWFLRNRILWDRWVSSSPNGKYHLTIVFPGLRSLQDVWNFARDGFVFLSSGRFTEFPDYGYGLWGFFLLPVVLWSLTEPGVRRRVALSCLLVMAMMLCSTRQIRYYANIVPLIFCLLYANSIAAWIARSCSNLAATRPERFRLCCAAFIFAQVIIMMLVIPERPSRVLFLFQRRIAAATESIAKQPEPWQTFNRYLTPDDAVMGGRLDGYFDIDAKVYATHRALFGAFYDEIRNHDVEYFIRHPYLRNLTDNYFFNDRSFLETVGSELNKTGLEENPGLPAYLYRVDRAALDRIHDYVEEQGWDAEQTLIVSEDRAKRNPLMIHLGEKLDLPEFEHSLYRAAGVWNRPGDRYTELTKGESQAYFHPAYWYFEKAGKKARPSRGLTLVKRDSNLEQGIHTKKFSMLKPANGRKKGELRYKFRLPEQLSAEVVKVNVYLQARAASATELIKVLIGSEGMTTYAVHQNIDNRGRWFLAGQTYITKGEETVDVAVRLSTKTDAERVFVEQVGVVFSTPSQPLSGSRFVELARRDMVGGADSSYLKAFVGLPEGFVLEEGRSAWLIDDFSRSQIRSSSQLRMYRSFSAIGVDANIGAAGLTLPQQDGVLRYKFPAPRSLLGKEALVRVYFKGVVDQRSDALAITLEHLDSRETFLVPGGSYSSATPIAELELPMLSGEKSIRATIEMFGGRNNNETRIETLAFVVFDSTSSDAVE